MKLKNYSLFAALILVTATVACNNQTSDYSTAPAVKLENNIDSVSFSLGYQNAQFLTNEGATDFNYEQYLSGFINGMNKNETLTESERNDAINTYRAELATVLMDKNMKEGKDFLAANKAKDGIIETATGLQYKVLEEGSGKSPKAEDEVEVNYEGSLIDGRVFDSSYERGESISFPLNRVIRGWTEGVQLMKEGATYEFYIPAELAYGPNAPRGSIIGPNSTLIFKVELIKVK
tara:strand:- start:5567 stop:6268 length:702 start_codon:yes stop_codon:yes gene_type:complete